MIITAVAHSFARYREIKKKKTIKKKTNRKKDLIETTYTSSILC